MFGLSNGQSSSSSRNLKYEKPGPSKRQKSSSLPSSTSRKPLAQLEPYNTYNAYATSATSYVPQVVPTSYSSKSAARERRGSHHSRENAPATPSRLRYPAYNSGSVRSKYSESLYSETMESLAPHQNVHHHRHPYQQPQKKSTRVPMYRSANNAAGDHRPAPYPIYSSSANSVHTASTSTYWNNSPMSNQHRPSMPPRSSSYGSVAPSEPKPVLKTQQQHQSWSGNSLHSTCSDRPRVSFTLPRRRTTLHMHPLLSHSRLNRPPISYDVTYSPSSQTVVDRSTHSPIPSFTLAQPATEPPLAAQLLLTCSKLPWTIVATPSGDRTRDRHGRDGRERRGGAITNFDVLFAIHRTLSARVTPQEWEALGKGSRGQRKATQAYEKRCRLNQGGWDGGVRRVDFLGEKTRLIGVEIEKRPEGEVGKLVFGA